MKSRTKSSPKAKAGKRTASAVSKKSTVKATVKPAAKQAQAFVRQPGEWLALSAVLNGLVTQYKVPSYVQSDPLQIPYRFADDPKACELVAFMTALFSYGRRDLIIETITNMFRLVDNDPVGFLEDFQPKRDAKRFQHFVYRFNKGPDLVFLWSRLQWAYEEFGSLEALFMAGMAEELAKPSMPKMEPPSRLRAGIAGMTNLLLGGEEPQSYGLKFLLAHPDKGGACKRFNMFLRWMVRQDKEPGGKVDLGLWKDALKPSELLMPLDTHVMNMNGKLGLTARQDGSWRTAEEITDVFRLLCPEDPVKFDYALFGFSLDKRSPDEILSGLATEGLDELDGR